MCSRIVAIIILIWVALNFLLAYLDVATSSPLLTIPNVVVLFGFPIYLSYAFLKALYDRCCGKKKKKHSKHSTRKEKKKSRVVESDSDDDSDDDSDSTESDDDESSVITVPSKTMQKQFKSFTRPANCICPTWCQFKIVPDNCLPDWIRGNEVRMIKHNKVHCKCKCANYVQGTYVGPTNKELTEVLAPTSSASSSTETKKAK